MSNLKQNEEKIIANCYTIVRVLGDGASGVVSLGKDARTNERVAIKTPKMADKIYGRAFDHSGCMKTAARIYREIKILTNLQHPNIVTLKDVVCTNVAAHQETIHR
jgi:serine/threonine protein kinase